VLRHCLLEILHRSPRTLGIIYPAAFGATRFRTRRAEGLLGCRDRVRGRRARAEGARSLAVWLLHRDFLLVLLLVGTAVVLMDFPLVSAQPHHERTDIPDGRLRFLLQLSYIVVMPAPSFLAFRAVAFLSFLGR